MRRGGVVVEHRRPSTDQSNGLHNCPRKILQGREVKRGLLNDEGVEPHNVAIIVGELRVVVIVAPGKVGLKMSMNG